MMYDGVQHCFVEYQKLYTQAVFYIWKSLRVLQKARIKFVAHAIYTYLFFSHTYTLLLFCWKT